MKKILISVLILLLLIIVCFAIFKGIGFLKIKSINDIKSTSNKLDEDIEKSNSLANQEYPSKVQGLEQAIKTLKLTKQEYESKNIYVGDETGIGAVEVKKYKIHYLWTILGNYRKDESLRSINLDLKSTENQDVYDLQFTLIGNYVGITDYLYDIEDDEELKFQIKNFTITTPGNTVSTNTQSNSESTEGAEGAEGATNATTSTKTNTTKKTNSSTTTDSEGGTILQATFTVEGVGITLD